MSSFSNDFNKSLIEKWRKSELELREKLILLDTQLRTQTIEIIVLLFVLNLFLSIKFLY
jgi:hypothetical protein